jgi:hypothetical protein
MKSLQRIVIALVAISSATYVHSATEIAGIDKSALDRGRYSIIESRGRATFDGLVRGPNECGPDRAEPVWGAAANLLGYSCTHNENGG